MSWQDAAELSHLVCVCVFFSSFSSSYWCQKQIAQLDYWSNIKTMGALFLANGTTAWWGFLKQSLRCTAPHFNHHSSLSNRIYCSPPSAPYPSPTLPLVVSKDAPLLSLGCRMRRGALIYSQLLLQERGTSSSSWRPQIKSHCVHHHPAEALPPLTHITPPTPHVQISWLGASHHLSLHAGIKVFFNV